MRLREKTIIYSSTKTGENIGRKLTLIVMLMLTSPDNL